MSVADLRELFKETEKKQDSTSKAYTPQEMINNALFESVKPTLTVILTEFEYPPPLSYKQLFWLFPITRLNVPPDFVIRDKKPRPTTMRLGDVVSAWMISGKGADKKVICRGIPREVKNKGKGGSRSGSTALRGVFPNCIEMFLTSYTNTVYCKLFDTHVKFSGVIDHYGDKPADVPLLMEKIIGFIYRAERIQAFARANPTFVLRALQLFKGESYPSASSDQTEPGYSSSGRVDPGYSSSGRVDPGYYKVRIPTSQERETLVAALIRGKSEEDDGPRSSLVTARELLDVFAGICYDLHFCCAQPAHSDLQDIVSEIVSETEDAASESEDEEGSHETQKVKFKAQNAPPTARNLAYVTKPSLLVRSFQLNCGINRDALARCLAAREWMIAYYVNTIHKEVNVQVPPTEETYDACSCCEEDAMEVNVRVSKKGKVTVSGGCDTTNRAIFLRFMKEMEIILSSTEYNTFCITGYRA